MSEAQLPAGDTERHRLPRSLLHDLRTPLNHIIGFSALLIEQAEEPTRDNALADLQKIHAAGQQLLSLINDNFDSVVSVSQSRATDDNREEERQLGEIIQAKLLAGESGSGAAQGLVLVVDDVEANRDVLSRQLKRQGYAVALAENGQVALDRLRTGDVDVVLLDIMMPEMDGYEVLQRLKADPALRHIPVIMISALSELDSVVRCLELGAEDYLPKPFNPTLLKARLGASLDKKRARDREQQLAAALRAQNTEMAAWRKAQEADLAIARTTQQAIVSSAPARLKGWQVEMVYKPLIQVGGDVYGWRELDDDCSVFWIADATGHGVAAALFTTLVALLFNQAITGCQTADAILERVNAEFHSTLHGRAFMTACCAVVKTDGELSFAGAGHPPLLIRRREGTIETLPSRATMIGIYPALHIEPTVTTLAPGDAALLYSDGLYSSKEYTGERSTADLLAKSFAQTGSKADFLPRLIAQLDQTSGDGFDDDVAAIALHRQ
ncbi:MAG: SpoIIE family protein phosphatase [Chthoniobacterales bacterium]|nr:SpoIIE family protein phosphatase [Chthoniobacterales bacterium]